MPARLSIELRSPDGKLQRYRLASGSVDLDQRRRGFRRWFFWGIALKVRGKKFRVVLRDGDRQRHVLAGMVFFRGAALDRAQLDAEDGSFRQSSELKRGPILPLHGEGF